MLLEQLESEHRRLTAELKQQKAQAVELETAFRVITQRKAFRFWLKHFSSPALREKLSRIDYTNS